MHRASPWLPPTSLRAAARLARNAAATVAGRLRPGQADAAQGMRIAAADAAERGAGARAPRRNRGHQLVVRGQHRAVAGLERRHLVEQAQVVPDRDLAPIEMQQVIEAEEHAVLAQRGAHVEDVRAQRLDFAVKRSVSP